MKIPIEVSRFFSDINALLVRVEEITVPSLKKTAESHNGFFEYRIKSAASLTEKLQKGKIKNHLMNAMIFLLALSYYHHANLYLKLK
jgi:ppGpp synthetase/RelA/SpoT-type nucleotidyltranferase